MVGTVESASERDREEIVRTVKCPSCGAKPGQTCTFEDGWGHISHTGRYKAAVRKRLVPKLAGS